MANNLNTAKSVITTSTAFMAVSGKVHLTEPLGDVTILDVAVGNDVLKLVLPEHKAAAYNVGQPIDLSFQLADAHLFMTETGTRVT